MRPLSGIMSGRRLDPTTGSERLGRRPFQGISRAEPAPFWSGEVVHERGRDQVSVATPWAGCTKVISSVANVQGERGGEVFNALPARLPGEPRTVCRPFHGTIRCVCGSLR